MDDDRRSNVGGAESGVDASPAPDDVGEASGRELELRAKSLRARDTANVPERIVPHDEPEGDDVDGRA
ncbi:MAG TPA: hypothetical protein VEX86_16665 [Longimicrobium sp.]|nr:hypothetical protein [Longimicrobium sp.]